MVLDPSPTQMGRRKWNLSTQENRDFLSYSHALCSQGVENNSVKARKEPCKEIHLSSTIFDEHSDMGPFPPSYLNPIKYKDFFIYWL